MNDRPPLYVGQHVRNGVGHWYVVTKVVTPWVYQVESVDFHSLHTVGRSDLRADGE
jgi:hypothetical protein